MAKSAHSAYFESEFVVKSSKHLLGNLRSRDLKMGSDFVVFFTFGSLYFSRFPFSGQCIFIQRSHSERRACLFVQDSLNRK